MKQFEREVAQLPQKEHEETMEIISQWERQGLEKGLHAGKEELVVLMIEQRFGSVPPEVTKQLDQLSSEQLNELGKALFGFHSVADIEAWLTTVQTAR